MIPDWSNNYVGIPYAKLDCIALFRHVYEQEKGVILPDYDAYNGSTDIEAMEDQYRTEKESWIKLDTAEPLCLIMINIVGHPVHVGMCLDETYMLHTLKGHNSAIERFTSNKWVRRIEGFYKWPFM